MDIAAELAKPLPYHWRLKTVTDKARKPYPEGTRGQFLAYINARDVMTRLDAVVGIANWQVHHRENSDGSVSVNLSLRINGEWVEKEDVGYRNNPGSDQEEEPFKSAVSDGLKRAAVCFGIGRFLYGMKPEWVPIDPKGNPKRPLPNAAPEPGVVTYEPIEADEDGVILDPPPARQIDRTAYPLARVGKAGSIQPAQRAAVERLTALAGSDPNRAAIAVYGVAFDALSTEEGAALIGMLQDRVKGG